MKQSDRKLGMHRAITRRDLLHGAGALAVGSLAIRSGSVGATNAGTGAASSLPAYPPALDGLRGNHAGVFDVAHQLALVGRSDWGESQADEDGDYDLVVVGSGISGLSAAYFYRQRNPDARILILDAHDDFGGHARRNEFDVGGRRLIGYGGSQTLARPSGYSRTVKTLLRDLGVDLKRFETAYDQEFFRRNGLTAGLYFDQRSWGEDRMVPFFPGAFDSYLPVADYPLSAEDAVAQMPLSDPARRQLLDLLQDDRDRLTGIPRSERVDYLWTISYREFLEKHCGIDEPEVFVFFQDMVWDYGLGIEAVPAMEGLTYGDLPNWAATGLPTPEPTEPYIHHFPDGNASIARLLVRALIPDVAPAGPPEELLTAPFDYSRLDRPASAVRLRLDSTAVAIRHDGDPGTARRVQVTYLRGGQAAQAVASHCILAGDNAMIPYLCPELPEPQRMALARQVKLPILYTNVAIRNWRAWKKLGIGTVVAPGSYHVHASLDFPVSMGEYGFSSSPDEPVIVHLERFPHVNNQGLTPSEQHRAGRRELLSTPFETIERNTRRQLAGMLGNAGFDSSRDILAITVNRWAHGYASWYNPLFEPVYDDDDDPRYPHIQARRPFGRIAIANADAAANAMLEAAVEQAYRAVSELP